MATKAAPVKKLSRPDAPKIAAAGLKISKNTYVFEPKRKFSIVRHFQVAGSSKEGIEKLASLVSGAKTAASGFIRPQKEKKQQGLQPVQQAKAQKNDAGSKHPIYNEEVAREIERQATKSKSPLYASLAKIGVAAAIVIVFLVAFLLTTLRPVDIKPPVDPDDLPPPSFYLNFTDYGIATYGSEQQFSHSAYFGGTYDFFNISGANLSLKVYQSQVPSQIFVLQGPRVQADTYRQFRRGLDRQLSYYGMYASDLDPSMLYKIPGNSIVIVPTGHMPELLIGKQDSGKSMLNLLERGVTIVYLGFRFDQYYLDDKGSIKQSDQSRIAKLGLSFGPAKSKTTSAAPINLYDPQYELFSSAGGVETYFGTIYSVKINNGYFIALPQSLDPGWRNNGEAASQDVAHLVVSLPWLSQLANAMVDISANNSTGGQFFIFTNPYSLNGNFARFVAQAQDSQGRKVNGFSKLFLISQEQKGDIYFKDGFSVLSSDVTGQPVRLTAVMRENEEKKKVLFFQAVKDWVAVKSSPLQKTETSLQSPVPFDFDASLQPGVYLARVVDEKGYVYAKAIFEIAKITIKVEKQDFARGNFEFSVYAPDGIKIRVPRATVALGSAEIDQLSKDTLTYTTGPLDQGNYTFTITIGKVKTQIPMQYTLTKAFYEEPINIALGVLALLMAAIGAYLRRPEIEMFSLDIPDFPPTSTIKIPVTLQTVAGLMRQVNRDYSWDYMPLSLQEIKNAFRKISFGGKPILIGDYNLERVLEKMQKKGIVFEKNGMWGLCEWAGSSKKSATYLVLFRQLRDIFVNLAIRFTPLLSSKDYDSKISIGQDIYIHIYQGPSTAVRALNTVGTGLTVIVFEDQKSLDAFKKLLAVPAKHFVALKLEHYQGNILLLTPADLVQVLKNLKPN
ncbi:hypothetical protein FJZ26_01810 [Candidatus Parvarchaeota archaeon]|nr:hypothetical protein [Candidatus Parvarchaeota archaeon]